MCIWFVIQNIQWLPLLYHDKFVACLEDKKPKQVRPPSDGPAKVKIIYLSGVFYSLSLSLSLSLQSDLPHPGTGASHKWLKVSQKSKPSYSYMSKALKKATSKTQFSMATGPAQKLLGERNASTLAGAGGHMANLLMDSGLSTRSSVESFLPCHQTDVSKIQELMLELMNTYSIVGVSDIIKCLIQ